MEFDLQRARLMGPDFFRRFRVADDSGVPLPESGARPGAWIIEIERAGERHGFYAHQLAYHHLAQGKIRGVPYLVSF